MKPSSLLLHIVLSAAAAAQGTPQLPTWPSPIYDEMEGLMQQYSGYRGLHFSDAVVPCSSSQFAQGDPGRMSAAEWIRSAYHDVATANLAAGTGGIDASIVFETARGENVGSAILSSLSFFEAFHTARSSRADLIALGVHTATRSCGGPFVPYRAGRVDAVEAGPPGVPQPNETISTLTGRFEQMGFNATDMIGLIACGHTLGGVHSVDFPQIVPDGSQPTGTGTFDTTRAEFDNRIVTEYLDSNSSNPLLVGPAATNSDARVFGSDGNVTMKALADATAFADQCKVLFERMINTVPATVQLTNPIIPYEVKPGHVSLSIASNTTLSFVGEVRVRTTLRKATAISTVQLQYVDINGGTSGPGNSSYAIEASRVVFLQGIVSSFDEEFTWYGFNTTIPSSTGISSYSVILTLTDGTVETHNNNNVNFPAPGRGLVFFQSSASCGARSTNANATAQHDSTIVVALHTSRLSLGPPSLNVTARRARPSTPLLSELFTFDVGMQAWTDQGAPPAPAEYVWFRATYSLDTIGFPQQSIDVISGAGNNVAIDGFRSIFEAQPFCPAK